MEKREESVMVWDSPSNIETVFGSYSVTSAQSVLGKLKLTLS